MNIAGNERLLDKLAAEYVLGTLKGGARRRYERWLQTDPMVRRATAEWQDRLHPMAEFAPSMMPPAHVWPAIAASLALQSGASAAVAPVPPATDRWRFWRDLRDDLGFWRGLGLASTAVATILVAVLATRAPHTDAPVASYIAMLADDKAQPVALVTGDETTHRLTVKLVLPQSIRADQSLQLWAVPKSGSPRSLGLLTADVSISLALPANTTPESVTLLAVSLEPKGGSPNPNSPSGP
ncbi:MAG: anti-sigma factor, partial [Herminiimonas sp.]|nr:anti-sigma factor [Herminiimonas sp.]